MLTVLTPHPMFVTVAGLLQDHHHKTQGPASLGDSLADDNGVAR